MANEKKIDIDLQHIYLDCVKLKTLIEDLQKVIDGIPEEHQDSATIEVTCHEDTLGGPYMDLDAYYYRPFTKDEIKKEQNAKELRQKERIKFVEGMIKQYERELDKVKTTT